MTIISDGLKSDVARLIKEIGREITLRKLTAENDYDDATGKATVVTNDYRIRGFVQAYKDYLVNGTTILQSDRVGVISTKGMKVDPQVQDRLVVGDVVYTIMDAKRHDFNGDVVAWKLHLRS